MSATGENLAIFACLVRAKARSAEVSVLHSIDYILHNIYNGGADSTGMNTLHSYRAIQRVYAARRVLPELHLKIHTPTRRV